MAAVSARTTSTISEGERKFTVTVTVRDVFEQEEADRILAELMESQGQTILANPLKRSRR